MGITITEKAWKSVRPKSAKDSGVAGAIKGTDKACSKAINSMNASEVDAAGKAVDALDLALKTAQAGMASDKSDEAKKAAPIVKGWRTECTDYKKDLTARTYALKVEFVSAKYKEIFDNQKKTFDVHYAAARLASQGQAQPADKDILNWMGAARDMTKIATRSFIPNMSAVKEAREVKPEDVTMPPGVKDVKPKIDEIAAWCTTFAKQAKRDARGGAAAAGNVTAVEQALRSLMDDYTRVEALMKPVIRRAEVVATDTKDLATRIKRAVEQKSKDVPTFKGFAVDLKRLQKEHDDLDELVRTINYTWRESGGDMAKKNVALKKMQGFDQARHGAVSTARMQSNMMGIRRATLPLSEASKQLDRARRDFQATDMRGYM